jgi:hypothetical protein
MKKKPLHQFTLADIAKLPLKNQFKKFREVSRASTEHFKKVAKEQIEKL